MAAYYNEIDEFKCAWLKELIRANCIAPGDVDSRSITDVLPSDLLGYDQCHFFAGIAGWSYALRSSGWADTRPVWTGSCPCQGFSLAGKQKGFSDPRHLWPEWFRLIRECKPAVIFGEQVSSAIKPGWLDLVQSNLESESYAVGKAVFGACSVGSPNKRQRLYWVARGDRATGVTNAMGNSSRVGLEEWGCESGDSGQECETAERAGEVVQLANDSSVRQFGWGPSKTELWEGQPERFCDVSRLADAEHDGRGSNQQGWGPERREVNGRGGPTLRLANADGGNPSTEWQQRGREQRQQPKDSGNVSVAGPVNGLWSGSDWVLTRPQRVGDYPGLRPVESKSQQVVNGVTGNLGSGCDIGFPLIKGAEARIARLRGYGDAINTECARLFIQAGIETGLG